MQCGELCRGDTEQWFFFAPRKENEVRRGRPNRTTVTGYWKATGSPSYVYAADREVIGVRKSMVFYKGKAGSGKKTKWKMNEYIAITQDSHTSIRKVQILLMQNYIHCSISPTPKQIKYLSRIALTFT